jgi:hypothetical protein
MTRPAALLALAASVAAIAGCGSNDVKGTIPQTDADQLNLDLNAVQASTASGDCASAETSAQDFVNHVNLLPDTAGPALKDTLRSAGTNLETLVNQCQSGVTGPTGEQPKGPEHPSTKHTTTDTTSTQATTTGSTTTAPPPEEPPSPPGNGNGNANGQGNGNTGAGSPGSGNPGGGSTGGTGGTGIGGD